MGIKTTIRKKLEKVVGNYGYSLVKNTRLEELMMAIETDKIPLDEGAFAKRNPNEITLGWVIPPLGPGSGGHTTLFRTITNLSQYGIRSKVYIYGPVPDLPSESLRQTVMDYYHFDLGDNEIYGHTMHMDYVDCAIATSWHTAYVVNNFDNCISKFYFVQDFEPLFYSVGAEYYMARNTYKLGLRGITAGYWLSEKLKNEYGMETQGFGFSYQRDVYKVAPKLDKKNRIFFYARPSTGRRAFELGVLAFERLKRLGVDFEVVFAGQTLQGYDMSFDYVDRGVVSPKELSEIYSQCDLCLVMSLTNLSLLPLEIMASGSTVVINDGPNNSWLVNEDNSILVDEDPIDIAEKLKYYLEHEDEREKIRKAGMECVNATTWEAEAKKVADFIKDSFNTDLAKR